MPRQTRKYVEAMRIASTLGIQGHEDQETLYRALNTQGYYWDSRREMWEHNHEPPHPPTDLVKIRVWAETTKVKQMADLIIDEMEASRKCEFIERSEPYQCHPPKQLESRIYLTFRMHLPAGDPFPTGLQPNVEGASVGGGKHSGDRGYYYSVHQI